MQRVMPYQSLEPCKQADVTITADAVRPGREPVQRYFVGRPVDGAGVVRQC